MKSLGFVRHAVSVSVAAALLAGCSGSQPPIGAPGVVPQMPDLKAAEGGTHRIVPASSYKVLYRFSGSPDGKFPLSSLIDENGTLYGTTLRGGRSNKGTVYSISTGGDQKVIYSFRGGSDGANPRASVVDVNGTLFGTTSKGGSSDLGTVYSVTTAGAERVLHTFTGGSDGASPSADLIAVNGTLYGTTALGGANPCPFSGGHGCGTVFAISTSGKERVLHKFTGSDSDGSVPLGGLVEMNAMLYGTTFAGGNGGGCGTVYSISTTGTEKVLHNFGSGSDGCAPRAGVTVANGSLYGTTGGGGSHDFGTVYSVTASGKENVIFSFYLRKGYGGVAPASSVIGVKGNLYGTTPAGRDDDAGPDRFLGYGTVYVIGRDGAETVLHGFRGSPDGASPAAGLIEVNGTLYGTASKGGDERHGHGNGIVFALTP